MSANLLHWQAEPIHERIRRGDHHLIPIQHFRDQKRSLGTGRLQRVLWHPWTLLQLDAEPEPHLEGMHKCITPAGRLWKGNATPPGTQQQQTFALNKIDLGYLFVPRNRFLHSVYVQMSGHKYSDMIGKLEDLRYKRASRSDTAQGQICFLIPKPTEQDIEMKRQGKPNPLRPRASSVSCLESIFPSHRSSAQVRSDC